LLLKQAGPVLNRGHDVITGRNQQFSLIFPNYLCMENLWK